MGISYKKLTIWKNSIKRMNEEDLEFILDFPECFEPQILKLAELRLKEMSQSQDEEFDEEEDSLEAAVLENLDELGCFYDYDEDGDIQFKYKNESFTIILHEDRPFITIMKNNLLSIDLDNYQEVTKLYSAINKTNSNGRIVLTYHISKMDNKVFVNSLTTTLFDTFIPNRVDYLELLLTYFFYTQEFLNDQMGEIYKKEKSDSSLN